MGRVYDEFATRTYLDPIAAGPGNRVVAILIWQSRTAQGMGGGLTMGMGAALFLAIWVVMMVAMMVPSALPVILAVAQAQRATGSERSVFANPWVFVGAYLLIWTLFGPRIAQRDMHSAERTRERASWLSYFL